MILTDPPFFQSGLRVDQPIPLFRLHLTQRNTGLLGHYGKQIGAVEFRTFRFAQLSKPVKCLFQIVHPLLCRRQFIEIDLCIQLSQQDTADLVGHLIVEPLQLGHDLSTLLGLHLIGQMGQLRLKRSDIRCRHIVHRLDQSHRAVDQIECRIRQRLLRQIALGQTDRIDQHRFTDSQSMILGIGSHGTF